MESAATPRPMIEVEGLHKSFDGEAVLAGVDLTVPVGTTTVLLGASGSGKTVLLRQIIGLSQPDRGRVRIDGVDLATLDVDGLIQLRHRMGIVFQGGALFDSLSVFDNVAFPLRENLRLPEHDVAPRVQRALARVQLLPFAQLAPAELSGGMRKRVAFARAIVHEPSLLLCDEPTAGLDPITAEGVIDTLDNAKRELSATSLVITGDLRIAFRLADQLALLHKGHILAHGTREEFQRSRDPDVLAFIHEYLEQVTPAHAPLGA